MRTLEEVRTDIDRVDQELIKYIMKRLDLVGEVKIIKGKSNKEIFDPSREDAIIEKLQAGIATEHHDYLKDLYHLIFSYSRELQKR